MSIDEMIDPRLLVQTQQQIRTLLGEIGRVARQDVPPATFFGECLTRVVEALAAMGGSAWIVTGDGFQLLCRVGAEPTEGALNEPPPEGHRALLIAAAQSPEGLVIPPQSSLAPGIENPSEWLLVLAAVRIEDQVRVVLEVRQRGDSPQRAQRNYLRFLNQVCELATEYFRQHQTRSLADRNATWQRIEPFLRMVHSGLDSRKLAYTIANDGRRMLGCDRVSVATYRDGRSRVEAISGQDTFDRRAATVRLMNALVSSVVAYGQRLTYVGQSDDLPPQIEQALEKYIDETHAQRLIVLPLGRAKPDEATEAERPIAAVVVEWLDEGKPADDFEDRLALVAEHSGSALANAAEHERLFMLSLWRAIGSSRWMVEARALPRTISIGIGALLLIAALFVVPWSFTISCSGTLQPAGRREVFAPLDGTVAAVKVKHGDRVEAGALLVELRNTDLEVSLSDITGQRMATQEQILAVDRARSLLDKGKSATPEERNRLEGQRSELRQKLTSLDEQLELYRQKRELLSVTSPIAGEVTTWNVEQLLRERPVRQGQVLVSVADDNGPWELELRMPEHRMGELAEADRRLAAGEPVWVTYRMATSPGVDHEGKVTEIHRSAELHGEEGNVVLIKVAIDKESLTALRPGADVTAKVHCGSRSLGYAMFHDIIAFVQSRILFYL